MSRDRSPLALNVLLVALLGFALYLGVRYMENQQRIQEEAAAARATELKAPPESGLPQVPAVTQESTLPSAPLYIKDDLSRLINAHEAVKDAFKGYSSIGLVLESSGANESFTVTLGDDGSVREVSKGIASGAAFTIRTTPESFRRIILLAKHENLLGVVERMNEMEFIPSSSKQEFINKLHSAQGFTSRLRT